MAAEEVNNPVNESVWSRPIRKARGPVPLHSRDSIAAAGIKIADEEGFHNVTMRAIARALGMVAPALYRYVNSRDEIVELMVDAAIGAPPAVEPGSAWTDAMLNLANSQLLHHQSHPWLMQASLGSRSFGPHTLAWFEAYLKAMKDADVPAEKKMELIAVVTGLVSLFAQQNQAAGSAFAFELLSVESHPNLAATLTQHSGQPDPEGPFNRAVLALCTGLVN